MPVLRLAEFGGMIPVMDESLLPDNAAVLNQDTRAEAGGVLAGRPASTALATVPAGTKYVYRIPLTPNTSALGEDSHWLTFPDADAKAVRTPNVNDAFARTYWTSGTDGMRQAPLQAFTEAGAPQANNFGNPYATSYKVGAPAPANSLGATSGGTPGVNDTWVTRAYLCSFINIFGEESPPSLPYEVEGFINGTWQLHSLPQPPKPAQLNGFAAIRYLRIYRTVTGLSGAATFFKVADIEVDPLYYGPDQTDPPTLAYPETFDDTLSDSQVSGNVQITPGLNIHPVDGMRGLTLMPNGILVGFKDNNLYFSEAYKPWSWPPEYTLTVEHPIVGLGVTGQTCVVCTQGFPAAVTGVRPDAMALQRHTTPLPCLSAGSILATPQGVVWASDGGLVLFANGGFTMLTDNIGRDRWVTDYSPTAIRACLVRGEYMAFIGNGRAFSLNPPLAAGVRLHSAPTGTVYCGNDVWSGRTWVLSGTTVSQFSPPASRLLGVPYTWRSKLFRFEQPINFSAYQLLFAPVPDNGETPLDYTTLTVRLKIFTASSARPELETLVYDQTIAYARHGETIRLPGGFQADSWRFEFSGTAPLRQAVFATSIGELRAV